MRSISTILILSALLTLPLATGCTFVTWKGNVVTVDGEKFVSEGQVCAEAWDADGAIRGVATISLDYDSTTYNGVPYSGHFESPIVLNSEGKGCARMVLATAIRIKDMSGNATLSYHGREADGHILDASSTDNRIAFGFRFSPKPRRADAKPDADPTGVIRLALGDGAIQNKVAEKALSVLKAKEEALAVLSAKKDSLLQAVGAR